MSVAKNVAEASDEISQVGDTFISNEADLRDTEAQSCGETTQEDQTLEKSLMLAKRQTQSRQGANELERSLLNAQLRGRETEDLLVAISRQKEGLRRCVEQQQIKSPSAEAQVTSGQPLRNVNIPESASAEVSKSR